MRNRLAVGLVALSLPLLGAAGPAYANHDYDGRGDCSWEGDCGDGYGGGYYDDGGGQEYDQNYGSRDDRNRNRNRNRGAFSPGPFDRSPIDFSGSCISLNCSGRDDGKKQPPPGKEKAGFFPPNPAKIPGQIQAFLKLTFDFVQGVFSFAV